MSEKPVVLAIVGGFSSGKSALINAILRQTVAPMGVTPITAVAHKFAWATKPSATFVYNDGTQAQRPLSDLASLSGDAASAARIREVQIGLPVDLLRDIEIWDTPGFGSNSLAHELAARKALADGDVVLWVTPIDQALNRSESEKLAQLRSERRPVVLVVNKADLADDALERDEAIASITADAGDLVRFVAWTSAKMALAAGDDSVTRAKSGLPALEARLVDVVLECRARHQDQRAASALSGPKRANDVTCPDCSSIGAFDDCFCVCGRSLVDQHRACPKCAADNVITRPRCRGCNLEFSQWERGEAYATQAETEIRRGLLLDAAVSLAMALEALPADPRHSDRQKAVAGGQERLIALQRGAARKHHAKAACAEWTRAIDLLRGLGVDPTIATQIVGQDVHDWGRGVPDPCQAVVGLEWWAARGVVHGAVLASRMADRDRLRKVAEAERQAEAEGLAALERQAEAERMAEAERHRKVHAQKKEDEQRRGQRAAAEQKEQSDRAATQLMATRRAFWEEELTRRLVELASWGGTKVNGELWRPGDDLNTLPWWAQLSEGVSNEGIDLADFLSSRDALVKYVSKRLSNIKRVCGWCRRWADRPWDPYCLSCGGLLPGIPNQSLREVELPVLGIRPAPPRAPRTLHGDYFIETGLPTAKSVELYIKYFSVAAILFVFVAILVGVLVRHSNSDDGAVLIVLFLLSSVVGSVVCISWALAYSVAIYSSYVFVCAKKNVLRLGKPVQGVITRVLARDIGNERIYFITFEYSYGSKNRRSTVRGVDPGLLKRDHGEPVWVVASKNDAYLWPPM